MLLHSLLFIVICGTVPAFGSIRGVQPNKEKHYQGTEFQCADGKQSFPISFVNDDYCDCQDGSDEPGTSACPNGSFHCLNANFKGQLISSSRVDDGICDCCDGSDEAVGKCPNNCRELGSHMVEEAKRIRREQAIGFQQRMIYATDGKAAKDRRDQEIASFADEVEHLRIEMEEREKHAKDAEEPAKEAKAVAQEAHDKAEAEIKMAADEETRRAAELEYGKIDSDQDGEVTVEELLSYVSSESSFVPHDEVTEMLGSGEVEPATILGMIENRIKAQSEEEEKAVKRAKKREEHQDKKPKLREVGTEEEREELWGEDGKKIEQPDMEDDEEEDYEDFEEELPVDDEEGEREEEEEETPVVTKIDYDPATQRLVDIYEEADSLYKEAKARHDNVERQLSDLKKVNDIDFGVDQEFFALKGQCFEISDKYTYKLCPFDKCDQAGTGIGRWGQWDIGADGVYKYNRMMYTNGNSCWQGPSRSTAVKIICGSENKLVSASEPAKCEYEFVFSTPAACTRVQEESEIHDEL